MNPQHAAQDTSRIWPRRGYGKHETHGEHTWSDTMRILIGTALLTCFFAAPSNAGAVPMQFSHTGWLVDNGMPVDGERNMTFTIYGDGSAELHTQQEDITFIDGFYSVTLGELSNEAFF